MIKLAIDLGSSVTKIYRADAGSGVVLAEPSCVAVSGVNREIKAIGKDAKKLVGKTAEFTEIVFPVYEGEIVDMRLAEAMLKEFLSRIGIRPSVLKRSFTVFSVPCGASAKLREDYAALAEECGLKRLCFVEAPFLAALGADAVLSEANPVFCLDIGGGVTNAAVLSLDGIIAGLSMNVGGNNMDANIIDRIEACKGLHIGALTAERVKNEIGSLAVGARGATVVEGSLVSAMRPGSVSVQASEIEPCIRIYIDKILEYASLVLQKLPAEVAAAVNGNGVYLSGGVVKLSFVPEYIAKKLDMRIHVCDEPQFAVVTGGGAAVRDERILGRIAKGTDD
ncbi:MAG TPA: rod shape-determining protein [Candidatus Scatosoma pullistercoris]|uniref:Rod shape-determining protein n=1 Tax=Candidatus Scatosoma pullistercoris TaxID=2840934 RepID=A0A9D1SFZ4_9FIRM|nr:rod shape-determining protein [Candidatus Scatosoma pullistercoris]